MAADAIILRFVKNVENYGDFRSHGFILAKSSLLTNKGTIHWSDCYDLLGDAKVEGEGTVVKGEKTKLFFKIPPKVQKCFEDGYGIYLDLREIGNLGLLPLDVKVRTIILYLSGFLRYDSEDGEEAPVMFFTQDIASPEKIEKIKRKAGEDKVYHPVSRFLCFDISKKSKLFHVGFRNDDDELTPVHFGSGGALYVFLSDAKTDKITKNKKKKK